MSKIKTALFVAICLSVASSQVKVSINSGNPVYPFPQFLPYKNATSTYENLATRPGVGVTHAEMEQVIRDGYQIQMNRAEKIGGGVGGKDYIRYRSSPQCSEGDGYGLLGAAAMSDKETFDGMWLYIHDFTMNKVKKYSDCKDASPGYQYSHLPGWTGSGANSAADGDVDIALALLIAYLQWGEFMGIKDACGEQISYKKEAIEFLKGLTDTLIYSANGNYLCGDIGLDGYIKGGDSWAELTSWANNTSVSGFPRRPDAAGGTPQHIDYAAPSYFRAFADFLSKEDSAKYAWNIKQFRRAEASSDWLMGKMLDNPKMLPFAGWVELSSSNVPTYTTFSDGEDFRCAWRTILNEVWHGNPSYTWDPVAHQIKSGTNNTFELDIGKRYARFLWDSRQEPWGNDCIKNVGGDKTIGFWGPEVLKYHYSPVGEPLGTFALNWVPGTGSPSAVVSQDYNLMAELYRCLEMKWDSENEERYINSIPHYFHGWFRMLGLLVLSGNYQAPSEIKPTANMKVYLDLDKTFAFEGDSATYTIDYRNYGTLEAKDVVITDTLHKDFVYISSTGGGVYDAGSHSVKWNISSVPGFKSSSDLSTTKGQVKLTIKVGIASQEQYRNRVSIKCSNGSGWTSNEYPNNITPVMERNYLDIAKRALLIEKKVSNNAVNPGNELGVSLNFENSSKAGWINGGRPGVHFSYSSAPLAGGKGPSNKMRFRLFHDANEAYIDYGNYRVSYFLFDAGNKCYKGIDDGCDNGWVLSKQIFEGVSADSVKVLHQRIAEGSDDHGRWNQKIVLQFSDVNDSKRPVKLTATTYHLDWYRGVLNMIHRGGKDPLRLVWDIHTGTYSDIDWSDDWSWNDGAVDADDESRGFPVTNDWTDPDKPNIVVNTYNPKECSSTNKTIGNILVEEWDGYTWRRVAGNGPLPGRDVENVTVRDTIPPGFVFVRFEGNSPFGVNPTVKGNVITWSIPKMQVKEKGTIRYVMKADGNCPMQNKTVRTRAWISADKESPFYDSTEIKITCDPVPPPPPEPTTMYKTAHRKAYQIDDTISYTIAYKQTHGTIITDATDIEKWNSVSGSGKMNISNGEITYDKSNTMMVYKYSYGTNGTIGGAATPVYYGEFSIIVRNSGSKYIEIRLKQDWDQMYVSFYNDEKQVGGSQGFTYTGFPAQFNYKIEMAEDTIRLWAGDTASLMPNISQTGFSVRSGYAGVKSGKDTGARVKGWNSHLDAGFDINITDAVPDGIKFVSGDGAISTGAHAGTKLSVAENNRVLKWDVVTGDTYLDAGDSVTVTWKGICEACKSDTILNTAFTSLMGHPKNSIGAQAKSRCNAKPGEPDHVDIIIDTLAMDMLNDAEIDSIVMDAGTLEMEIFAVVRDSVGNYLDKINLGKWDSRDPDIVSVADNPDVSWGAIITKSGSGKTVITVSKSGLKSDSVIIVAEAKPLWPVITSAVVLDNSGDIIPDEIRLTLTDTFVVNQSVENAVFSYKGKSISIALSELKIEGKMITVPLKDLTESDPTPQGTITLNLLINKEKKQSSKKVTDGIGPALVNAVLSEEVKGTTDTLFLKFTEVIRASSINGKTIQLIRKSSGDTVNLDVKVLPCPELDISMKVVVTSTEGNRPQAGDFLRLVPGEKDGKVADYQGNLPHLLNRAVTLKVKPAQITGAWYTDENGDGVVDAVYLKFLREVEPDDVLFSLYWSGVKQLEKITSERFSYNKENYTVKVSLPDSFKTDAGIKTSVNMAAVIAFKSYPEEIRNCVVVDSAAPVIDRAVVSTGDVAEGKESQDILSVYFSERVQIDSDKKPFFFIRVPGTEYKIDDLHILNIRDNLVTFSFTTVSGVEYPESGDSIWINSDNAVKDENWTWQRNGVNRHAPLTVKVTGGQWTLKIGPNPFNPDSSKGVRFFVIQESKYKARAEIKNFKIKIYDSMGSFVYEGSEYAEDDLGYSIFWNGYNKKGRKVGKGTYLAVISVEDEAGTNVYKKKIGLKR
ncbi:MAG TPA: glycosyl hydrolase family 8 [Chitinispirillaceae bacterium]|nr:glycosyl hydrolase family 8 [Chitinispirillaceae bacterium]